MSTGGAWLFRRRRPAARGEATAKGRGTTTSSGERSANGWLDSADALKNGAEVVECDADDGDALLHEFFDTVIDPPVPEKATRH